MDNRAFYVYAIATSLAREGSDYLDCFWPLAVSSVARASDGSLSSIQRTASTLYSLDIPQHVLATLLRRAAKRGYIELTGDEYSLTDKGTRFVSSNLSEDDVQRRENALVDDIQLFATQQHVPVTRGLTKDLILGFLRKNLDTVLPYLRPGVHVEGNETAEAWGTEERLFMSYLHEADRAKPDQFRFVQDLVVGSLLTTLLTTPDAADVESHSKSKFRDCTIYLDSNVALSMLGLKTSEFATPAVELLSMLKQAGLHLRVFSFTISEICRLLGVYSGVYHRYVNSIPVDDIYSGLKSMGWTPEKVRSFVVHIDEHLKDIGVEVENVPTVHLDSYISSRPELAEELLKVKWNSDSLAINHDLAAIDLVLLKRNGFRLRLETCGSLFLSSDMKLAKFNQEHYEHQGNSTLAEVIPDRVLATVLWLKSPTGKPPMQLILAAYSSELAVQHRVWNRFYDVLSGLRTDGQLTDEDVSRVIYDPALEQTLAGIHEGVESTIDDKFVLCRAEIARTRDAESMQRNLAAIESSVRMEGEEMARQMVSAAEERSMKKAALDWEQNVEEQRRALRSNADKVAARWSTRVCVALTIMLIATAVWIWVRSDALVLGRISILLDFLGVGILPVMFAIWTSLRLRLRKKLAQRVFHSTIAVLDSHETSQAAPVPSESKSASGN